MTGYYCRHGRSASVCEVCITERAHRSGWLPLYEMGDGNCAVFVEKGEWLTPELRDRPILDELPPMLHLLGWENVG